MQVGLQCVKVVLKSRADGAGVAIFARPFVVGRKGWLFADTPQGAEASAIIYSLMETAKANSLRLDDYLLHLLSVDKVQ